MNQTNEKTLGTSGYGLTTSVFVVFASMVGTGILTTSGFTVASVGSHQWAWLLWIIGGILAICGAMSQAELVARNPSSGGDYVILSNAFGPLAGFVSGWVSVILGFAGPIAASSKAAASYFLSSFMVEGESPSKLAVSMIATGLVLSLSWMHSHSYSRSGLTQNTVTLIKILLLIILMIAGLGVGLTTSKIPSDWPSKIDISLTAQSLTSLIYISYAYTGWNSIGYIAGEVRNPQRNLPLSILIGTGFVTVLYLGLNLVYGLAWSAPELRELAANKGFDALAPIAELSARRLFGETWAGVLGVAISLMLIASVSAYVLTGPRIIHAMAKAGQFPGWAGKLSHQAMPERAIAIQVILAMSFIWSTSLESIIVVSSIGLALFSMLTISSIFWYNRHPSETKPGFSCPFYPVTPLIYLVGTGLLISVTIWNKPWDGLASLATIAIGTIGYMIFHGVWRKPVG